MRGFGMTIDVTTGQNLYTSAATCAENEEK